MRLAERGRGLRVRVPWCPSEHQRILRKQPPPHPTWSGFPTPAVPAVDPAHLLNLLLQRPLQLTLSFSVHPAHGTEDIRAGSVSIHMVIWLLHLLSAPPPAQVSPQLSDAPRGLLALRLEPFSDEGPVLRQRHVLPALGRG